MSTSSPTLSFISSAAMRRVALLLLVLPICFLGCQPPPEKLIIFLSGDSRGNLEPCGCRRDQAGGLPGRANILEEVPVDQRLLVDVGNLTDGTREYDLLKFGFLLEGMESLKYDVVNLGDNEAQLDLDVLKGALSKSSLPFVSANVIAKKTKELIAEPYRIVDKAGSSVGVVGVTACDPMDVGPGIEVRPAIEALAEIIPELRKKCDVLVVLAFVDEEQQKQIATKFHEVDLVLGGDVKQPSSALTAVNRASLYSVTNKGKVLGKIVLAPSGERVAVKDASMLRVAAEKVIAPKPIKDMLARYKQELRERRYELASVEGMERIELREMTADQFVGADKCISCHKEDHKIWKDSLHSHGLETLKKVKSEFDPDCLRCHTVGYARSTGFIDEAKTPELGGIQCENCHGRGKEHVETKAKTSLKPVTASTCVNCHDEENSENFKFGPFWAKIKH